MSDRTCAFFGYGIVGEAGLKAVCDIGVTPVAVYTHSQGQDSWQTNLQPAAARLGLDCHVDVDWSAAGEVSRLERLAPDVLLSFYYRDILPVAALETARLGGLNLHGSILPDYRGRAPVNWVVLKGELESGATLHVMENRPDRGAVVGMHRFPIATDATAWNVLCAVRDAGVELVHSCLGPFLEGILTPVSQASGGSTFLRRTPEDGLIDWGWSTKRIYDLVRAVTRPYPGAFFELNDGDGVARRVFVWWLRPLAGPALATGEIRFDNGRLLAGTGNGVVEVVDWNVDGMTVDASQQWARLRFGPL